MNNVDLSGKKIVPFCTFGSGGLESSVAADEPREPKPDMPPMGPMKVYVTVINGETPVFTRVVR